MSLRLIMSPLGSGIIGPEERGCIVCGNSAGGSIVGKRRRVGSVELFVGVWEKDFVGERVGMDFW